jgi:hypothetical protein
LQPEDDESDLDESRVVDNKISLNDAVKAESRKTQRQRNKDARRIKEEKFVKSRIAKKDLDSQLIKVKEIEDLMLANEKAPRGERVVDASKLRLGPMRYSSSRPNIIDSSLFHLPRRCR